jgi:uncharacterized membrane protein
MSEASFWRTEIWHPLSVHFPIAILILATLAQSLALVLRTDARAFWQKAASYLLYLGVLTAWLGIYTGHEADGLVARKICDPTVLKDHEIAAFNMAYLFSAAAALTLALPLPLLKTRQAILRLLVLLLMAAGTFFLVRAGHLGASVVYQQAGGVLVPKADCADFE